MAHRNKPKSQDTGACICALPSPTHRNSDECQECGGYIRAITLRDMKPTRKMLKKEVWLGGFDTTIGILTVDQLRVALYQTLTDYEYTQACMDKALVWLNKVS